MPYSNPAPAHAPVPVPLPVHSQGRPGHRRSFSYTPLDPAAPPQPTNTGAFASLGALPRRKPASFHLAADDDDDDSSPEDDSPPKPAAPIADLHAARFAGVKPTPAGKPTHLNTDDEDDQAARGLPPLKLKIPGVSSSSALAGSPVLSKAGGSTNSLPFPKAASPPRSRTPSNLEILVNPASPETGRDSPRPLVTRTTSSSSIILSNGKPLKSSLKSSSSSPNIPFPSQSLVPSRIYAEIAAQQQRERDDQQQQLAQYHVPQNQRHTRAASAPNLPNFDPSSSGSSGSETPDYSLTVPSTPSAPKAVHFPDTEEGGLTTVRIFKRTAKPVSLLLPGASGGEETETETDGEGYNSGGANNGVGYHYGMNNTWGFGAGYTNPWDRYTRQNTQNNGRQAGPNGYPFPRMGPQAQQKPSPSPLGQTNKGLPTTLTSATNATKSTVAGPSSAAAVKRREKKRIVYELDADSTSSMPKRGLTMFDNVFLESVELKCDKAPVPGASSSSASSSSSEDDDDQDEGAAGVSSRLRATLNGTLLVRNVAYEKHVTIRFTLDDWHTTSEVKASYKESLGSLPDRWVKWVCGDRNHVGIAHSDASAKPPGTNPQWDRFEFSINLSDYARSRSLANRTLWLVARYAVPGEVRVPVPQLLPGFNFPSPNAFNNNNNNNPSFAPPPDNVTYTSDLLKRCDPEMLEMLVAGLSDFSGASATRRLVDADLCKRQVGVSVGLANEWWDNNANGNYRIAFREKEVVSVKVEKVQQQQQVEEPKEVEQPVVSAQQRRKNVLSCPPSFTNATPPPPSIYSALSPPQLSVSTSVDSGSYDTVKKPYGLSSSSSTSDMNQLAGSIATGAPINTAARRAETNKALAETTLERLKRLNLRNYAAPTAAIPARTASNPLPFASTMVNKQPSAPSLAPSSSTSSETSTNDSTPLTSPLHTPTMGSMEIVVVGEDQARDGAEESTAAQQQQQQQEGGDGKLGALLKRASATPTPPATATPVPIRASSAMGIPGSASSSSSSSSSSANNSDTGSGRNTPTFARGAGGEMDDVRRLSPLMSGSSIVELGTSPPFSAMGEMGFGGRAFAGFDSFVDGKNSATASANSTTPLEGTSAGSSINGTGMGSVTSGLVNPLPLKPRQLILENIREKSTSSPQRSPGGSGRNSPAPGFAAALASAGVGAGVGVLDVAAVAARVSQVSPLAASFVVPPPPPAPGSSTTSTSTTSTSTTAGTREGASSPHPTLVAPRPQLAGKPQPLVVTASPRGSPAGSGSDSAPASHTKSGSTSSSSSSTSGSSSKKSSSSVPTTTTTTTSGAPPGSSARHHAHTHSAQRRPGQHGRAATTPNLGAGGHGHGLGGRGLGLVFGGGGRGSMEYMPSSPASANGYANGQANGYANGRANGQANGNGNGVVDGPPSRQGSTDDLKDQDSVYQAFVRQWCFASAPSPAQAGGFGRVGFGG